MISCFRYMLPALDGKRARLVYDDSIEQRGVSAASVGIISEVNTLMNGDLRRQWFIYTKNRASPATSDPRSVVISGANSCEGCGYIEGEIRSDLLQEGAKWLSFGGTALGIEQRLRVLQKNGSGPVIVTNAIDLTTFKPWWPQYEASSKHRAEGYFRSGGQWVSPMPLNSEAATEALMASVQYCGDRYALYCGKYYRFPKTHIDRNVYHGFLIDRDGVPESILNELES
jgi:hypothetical protein